MDCDEMTGDKLNRLEPFAVTVRDRKTRLERPGKANEGISESTEMTILETTLIDNR